jgi:hypothetical protein
MLRITTVPRPRGAPTLLLEGRLIGPWVEELHRTAASTGAATAIDLGGVTFADDDGVTALRRLRSAGAVLVGASAFLAALIDSDGRATTRDVR